MMLTIPPLTTGAAVRLKPPEVQEALAMRQRLAGCSLPEALAWWNELVARCQKAVCVDEASLATQLMEMASAMEKEPTQ